MPRRHVYGHTGWRRIGDDWLYLHAGGAIGASGAITDIQVSLPPSLMRYVLPNPPTGADRTAAVRASLALLSVAPDRLTIPLLAAVYRAAVERGDFSLHLVGKTQRGKSELASLAQRHYGPTMDRLHLPCHWTHTENALEATAFVAQHALLVIDDFNPHGTTVAVAAWHAKADRVLRAQGNASGRQRMTATGELRPVKAPRGLILSTGEDIPRGESLRARLLVLEVGPTDVDFARLTACQADAAGGLYATALAGFLSWLAPWYEQAREYVREEAARLRQHAVASPAHRRAPGIVADLAAGWGLLLAYARDVGAISFEEARALWRRGWEALAEAGRAQVAFQVTSDPARRFVELVSAAIASKVAYLADPLTGKAPAENPGGWGWREHTSRDPASGELYTAWQASGERIGWVSGQDVYLEPDVAHAVATRLMRAWEELTAVLLAG